MLRHYAALLVAVATVVTATAGVIPVSYAWIAPVVATVLYALAGVKNPTTSRPGKIVG